ncbi:FHIPEP family type III secretion protein, partial [bacterium]|nr:FHIPEP family type III secretion protein [bacterium]
KITGKKIVWIEKEKTKDFWYHGIMGSEYIAKALEYIAVKYVDELLDYEDLDKYIDVVNDYNPFLVENVVPDFISLADLRFILTSLIREKVSIKDIIYIFEKINDYAEDSVKADILKKIRLALSRQICKKYDNGDETISVFELSDETFEEILLSCEDGEDCVVKIDGEFAEKIANKILKMSKKLGIDCPKLIVPMDYRQLFFGLLSLYVNNIVVLAQEEIGCNYKMEILGEI